MNLAWLMRYERKSTHTLGVLVVGTQYFYTIERPWLGNARNISCIPGGEYETHFLPRSASGKYRNVYHLQDVSQRSGILIHNGNLVSHSRGCIIIGEKPGYLGGQRAVLSSRSALRKFRQAIGEKPFKLRII
jgi:hypothetical protein